MAGIDQQYAGLIASQSLAGLLVEGREVAVSKRRRGGERLERDAGTLKLTIDVTAEILRYLQYSAFDLALLERGHPMQSKGGKPQQRQRQGEREQDQERSNALGREPVYKQSRWHEMLRAWRREHE
jgi:hypothetical protein